MHTNNHKTPGRTHRSTYWPGESLLVAFFCTCLIGSVGSAQAVEPDPALASKGTSNRIHRDPQAGLVRSVHSLLNSAVQDHSGTVHGTIADIRLNIGNGSAAEILIKPVAANGGKHELLPFPMSALRWTGVNGEITLDKQSATPAVSVLPGDPDSMSRVVLFSSLRDTPVHNARGDRLGQIVDFGLIPQQQRIAYALLTLSQQDDTQETLYPIPLAAFVVQENSKQWFLELPPGILENTPTIKKNQWPPTVPSAWSEYVSVRYGRSPIGGVQVKLHEKK